MISVLSLCFSFIGCSEKKEYRDGLECSELLGSAAEKLSGDIEYKALGADHVKYNFDDGLMGDHAFLASASSSDINEMGIFHASDKKECEDILELCEDYFEDYLEEKEEFIASYAPRELEKLKNAEARRFGNYVAYAILSENDKDIFFDTVEKLLKK